MKIFEALLASEDVAAAELLRLLHEAAAEVSVAAAYSAVEDEARVHGGHASCSKQDVQAPPRDPFTYMPAENREDQKTLY